MPVPEPRSPSLEVPQGDLRALMVPAPSMTRGAHLRIVALENKPFFLRTHPRCWDAEAVTGQIGDVKLDGVYWLPEISMISLYPGANGIRTLTAEQIASTPEMAWERAKTASEKAGWIWIDPDMVIPADCLPRGVPAGGYLRPLACTNPQTMQAGVHHVEAWDIPVASLPGDMQTFKQDREAYNRWRAWLVLSGIVKAPLPQVVERSRAQAARRIERALTLPISQDLRDMRVQAATKLASAPRDAVLPGTKPADA